MRQLLFVAVFFCIFVQTLTVHKLESLRDVSLADLEENDLVEVI